MKRTATFFAILAAFTSIVFLFSPACAKDVAKPDFEVRGPRAMTRDPGQHFFGYYGISPWNSSGSLMLTLESTFHDRMPEADDTVVIGVVETESRKFRKVAETKAWNLQQGAMQRWLPSDPDNKIIYNDRTESGFAAIILDISSGDSTQLPRPISEVSPDGRYALSLNYARLRRLRPVTGYAGVEDTSASVAQPDDDGVFFMDIETGETKLIVSITDAIAAYDGEENLSGKEAWLSHTTFNPSANRFLFLLRYSTGMSTFHTAMFTVSTDGSDLKRIIVFDRSPSHFGWRDDDTVLATIKKENGDWAHVLIDIETGETTEIGAGVLTVDGHPSFSPDGRWLVTDTYPDASMLQRLYLVDMQTDEVYLLGKFKHSPQFLMQTRCDLHPRWSPGGDMISFDSIDKGSRQIYVLKLELPE